MANLRRLNDFDLVSKLAEIVDKLNGDNYEMYLDIEEQVSYNQKLSNRQREKAIRLITSLSSSNSPEVE